MLSHKEVGGSQTVQFSIVFHFIGVAFFWCQGSVCHLKWGLGSGDCQLLLGPPKFHVTPCSPLHYGLCAGGVSQASLCFLGAVLFWHCTGIRGASISSGVLCWQGCQFGWHMWCYTSISCACIMTFYQSMRSENE